MPMKLDFKLILNVYHETSTSRRNAIEGTEWPEKIRKAFVCRLYRYNKYVPCFSPLTSTSYSLPSTTFGCFRWESGSSSVNQLKILDNVLWPLILVSSLHSSLPWLLQLLLLNCCPSLITLILCQMSMYDSYSWSSSPEASLQSIRGVEILRISSADASCFSCQYLFPATSSSWSVKLYAPDWGWKRFSSSSPSFHCFNGIFFPVSRSFHFSCQPTLF